MLKNKSLKLPKYHDAIRSHLTQCACCSANATDIAHYSGLYSEKLGKGRGCKSHDYAVAYLCRDCHTKLDNYKNGNDDERAFNFISAIFKTAQSLTFSISSTMATNKYKSQYLVAKAVSRELRWQLGTLHPINRIIPHLADLRDEIEVMGK